MRKLIVTLIALIGLGATGLAFANGFGAGIKGSPHDFTDNVCGGYDTATPEWLDPGTSVVPNPAYDATSGCGNVIETGSGGWNQREEICRVCHVPHDHQLATKYYEQGLLWNHKASSATYTTYDSDTMDATEASNSTAIQPYSKLCLSCHDGTVAVDTFDKYTADTSARRLGDTATADADWYAKGYKTGFGTTSPIDMQGNHPISITYDAGADSGLHDDTESLGGETIADALVGGKVECNSCHDVHDTTGEARPGTHLLRDGTTAATGINGASSLCLSCHDK
jgi:hypothetical protein